MMPAAMRNPFIRCISGKRDEINAPVFRALEEKYKRLTPPCHQVVQCEPPALDRQLEPGAVFRRRAHVAEQKRAADLLDIDPALLDGSGDCPGPWGTRHDAG